MPLSKQQQAVLDQPITSKIFLSGSAGTGKTTAGVLWLRKLLVAGIPAHQILVFVPQRTLASPYLSSLHNAPVFPGDDFNDDEKLWNNNFPSSLITTVTLGGLARRMVELFWPLISREAGFASPNLPPQFLTMETAQYFMAYIVRPLIEEQGYFESLTVNRNRIYSQILDNLNKAAFVGFPFQEISARLKSSWIGSIEQLNVYDDAQDCAQRFRQFCLENNLLDFSLQVEIFIQQLWSPTNPTPAQRLCREYLKNTYRHVIVDNLEEDTPIAHDVLRAWLPDFESALLIFDENAGYRFFLGADVHSAATLQSSCNSTLWFTQNLVNEPGISQLKNGIHSVITRLQGTTDGQPASQFSSITDSLITPKRDIKYFPSMIQWVAEQIASLVDSGVPPSEIVVLAPFMPDVMRFSLAEQFEKLGIPYQSHRPSRALREETAVKTLLTLAALTYAKQTSSPSLNLLPKRIDLALALMESIQGLDLVRSQLLTNLVYVPARPSDHATDGFPLKPFEAVPPDVRDRITYRVGTRYDQLRDWLYTASQEEHANLDFFMNQLFGEILSQPGFGFNHNLDRANTIATLIESIQKFRWSVAQHLPDAGFAIGQAYLQMVMDGVIAAQYIRTWESRSPDTVFFAPAYTFLVSNQPVDYQFWLDIGSPSWYQRLDQPLTHPYVLSRNWEHGRLWDAHDELDATYETLHRLTIGLLNRCRKRIYIGMSNLDVRGYENRGLLIRIINDVWRRAVMENA